MDKPLVCGLVLTGGKSSRMGEDKAMIRYHEKPQAIHLAAMLKKLGLEAFISARQGDALRWKPYQVIEDKVEGIGPMAGLLAASSSMPDRALFVLACDYPLLRVDDLRWMLQNRSAVHEMTTVGLKHTLGEPLLAVWEPSALRKLREAYASGNYKLMDLLANFKVRKLSPPDSRYFQQVNDPQRREEVEGFIRKGLSGKD